MGARGQIVKQGLVCGGDGNSGEVRRGEEPVPSQRTVSRRDVSVIQTVEATENRSRNECGLKTTAFYIVNVK